MPTDLYRLRFPRWGTPLVRCAFYTAWAMSGFRKTTAYRRRAERWGNRCAALTRKHVRFERIWHG